jgi:mannan endo-1,4-beta-mannosidase
MRRGMSFPNPRATLRGLLACGLWLAAASAAAAPGFVTVADGRFERDGAPYCFVGSNLWYGAYLGADADWGDRDRLARELDLLRANGITNVRVLGASEASPSRNALRITFRDATDRYNETLLRGLDRLLDELAARDMQAVIYLNNFWEWSGGMGAYLYWTNGGEFVDLGDPEHPWPAFPDFTAAFYESEAANRLFRDYVALVVSRTNTVNGRRYADDPAIMAWQLANEPRPGYRNALGFSRLDAYTRWIADTAGLIRSLDPNHLVSLGSEGTMGCLQDEACFLAAHRVAGIDYLTFHMWPKNWSWFDAGDPAATFPRTRERTEAYIADHLRFADRLGKPVVLEEFGLERDGGAFDPAAPTTLRDRLYRQVFEHVERSQAAGGPFAGSNFWTWGGYGRAAHDDGRWRAGDTAYTGDPPQEAQGLNSVFDSDASTLEVIRGHAQALARLGCAPGPTHPPNTPGDP